MRGGVTRGGASGNLDYYSDAATPPPWPPSTDPRRRHSSFQSTASPAPPEHGGAGAWSGSDAPPRTPRSSNGRPSPSLGSSSSNHYDAHASFISADESEQLEDGETTEDDATRAFFMQHHPQHVPQRGQQKPRASGLTGVSISSEGESFYFTQPHHLALRVAELEAALAVEVRKRKALEAKLADPDALQRHLLKLLGGSPAETPRTPAVLTASWADAERSEEVSGGSNAVLDSNGLASVAADASPHDETEAESVAAPARVSPPPPLVLFSSPGAAPSLGAVATPPSSPSVLTVSSAMGTPSAEGARSSSTLGDAFPTRDTHFRPTTTTTTARAITAALSGNEEGVGGDDAAIVVSGRGGREYAEEAEGGDEEGATVDAHHSMLTATPDAEAAAAASHSTTLAVWERFFQVLGAQRSGGGGDAAAALAAAAGDTPTSPDSLQSLLSRATAAGDLDAVSHLLLAGASPSALSSPPSAIDDVPYPLAAMRNGGKDTTSPLLLSVAMGSCTGFRLSPLHIAAARGDVRVLALLADEAASEAPGLEVRDEQEATPLLVAGLCLLGGAAAEWGEVVPDHLACVQFLIESAADPRATSCTGAALRDVVTALIARGGGASDALAALLEAAA